MYVYIYIERESIIIQEHVRASVLGTTKTMLIAFSSTYDDDRKGDNHCISDGVLCSIHVHSISKSKDR